MEFILSALGSSRISFANNKVFFRIALSINCLDFTSWRLLFYLRKIKCTLKTLIINQDFFFNINL